MTTRETITVTDRAARYVVNGQQRTGEEIADAAARILAARNKTRDAITETAQHRNTEPFAGWSLYVTEGLGEAATGWMNPGKTPPVADSVIRFSDDMLEDVIRRTESIAGASGG